MNIPATLCKEFSLLPWQVNNVIELIDTDNTIPFIARYRKELTGGMSDSLLRDFHDRLSYLRQIEKRKEEVARLIDEQGKLTPELEAAIHAAEKLAQLEDIYAPYRKKRRTRATVAKEKGLEPLSEIISAQEIISGDLEEICAPFIDPEKGVATIEEAIAGAMDIIAENIADNSEFKGYIRDETLATASLFTSSTNKAAEDKRQVYALYHDYSEPLTKMPGHRILAINRAEKEGFISVKMEPDSDKLVYYLKHKLAAQKRSLTTQYVEAAAEDAYSRLIAPSVENELRNMLTDEAGEGAIRVFSANLKQLLLQPPIKDKVVLGLDPAYRTGCKLAVVDPTGKVLETSVIYPTPPHNRVAEAANAVQRLIETHGVTVISIGNGTASRESELFIIETIKKYRGKVAYTITNESGASVYSASKLATEEFPELDVAERSAISIARRLQDPLAELVKIEPKAIGVGQYQHDMNQKRLGEALGGVVVDCVNSVGVNLNTASSALLSYVSGLSPAVVKNIMEYRHTAGKFKSRKELTKIPRLGKQTFIQCAGFLRIPESGNILDNTGVHPESYQAAEKLLKLLGYTLDDVASQKLGDIKERVKRYKVEELATFCDTGVPTLNDIIDELQKPGRDVRDSLPQINLKTDVADIADLKPGMRMTGTVRNVTDFGAFVDIGVHQDGLVHISKISKKFIKHPLEAVSVGDVVEVRVVDADAERGRISLTMTE